MIFYSPSLLCCHHPVHLLPVAAQHVAEECEGQGHEGGSGGDSEHKQVQQTGECDFTFLFY